MAMFPIFLIGVVAGALLTYIVTLYKKETPSEAQFRIKEAEIIALKSDLETMEKLTEKLYAQIDELKKKK